MLKGIKCDWCEEEIQYKGKHVSMRGLDFYYCDEQCMCRDIEFYSEWEDVEEPEDYNI